MKGISTGFSAARRALFLLSVSVPAVMIGHEVVAQQITSGVRGTILAPDGSPVANAQITVQDTRTGRATRGTTNASGQFAVTGLEVGGPYTVLIESARYQNERVEGLNLSLSETANIRVALSAGTVIEEIVVTAAASVTSKLAVGPGTSFGLETLGSMPSINRDFRDIIRIDPRVTIDDNNDGSIQCLGGNNRFNSITIDGVRNADAFGLNASGFPSRSRIPIPFDSIREVAVEFSPFDVEFGQFTGCNVNLVTQSGSNEFHGSAFAVFNSQALTGKTLEGNRVVTSDFRNWDWGVDLSGPIVEDKLFLYFAYEETSETNTIDRGPIGGGFADEDFITVAEGEQISGILQNSFGRDPLGFPNSLPNESRRFLARLDWFLTDKHRAAFTYTRLRESEGSLDDFGFGRTISGGAAFGDNARISGSEIETYSLRMFSDWTENFSTEFRLSRIDNQDIQDPAGGGEALDADPKVRIEVANPGAISGPGRFRSANDLKTQINQLKIKGDYRAGDHTLTLGYELDNLDVFNLFADNATGTLRFATIADLAAGQANFARFNGSFTGDINDAAANFKRSIHSVYFQDSWQATSDLLLQFGLRYDFYATNDSPIENSRFGQRFGFDNTTSFKNLDIILPRFGFTYDAPWEFFGRTTIRGGAGVFTGGDPTVWFSNAFSNFGFGLADVNSSSEPCTPADLQVLDTGGNFTGLPQCLVEAAILRATGGDGRVDAVDPGFDIPSVVRGSMGLTHFTDFGGAVGGFFDDWEINLDIIHTRNRNAADTITPALTQTGIGPDGRPLFRLVDPLREGCDAVFLGLRRGFGNVTPECFGGNPDTLLTNVEGDNGGSVTVSGQFGKLFEYTAFNRPATFDFNAGYAFTSARTVNPMTSSQATSNFRSSQLSDLSSPPIAQSQFANRHNVTMSAVFRHDFWEDNATSLGILFRAVEGTPLSFTFASRGIGGDPSSGSRQLLYVPTGPDDPLVDFSLLSQQQIADLFRFLEEFGLDKFAGQIAPRNKFRNPWFKDLDIRLSQEVPGFFGQDKFELSVNFDNFLNLISSSANIQKRFRSTDNPAATSQVIGARISDDGRQFQLLPTNLPVLVNTVDASIWRIQVGVRYRF